MALIVKPEKINELVTAFYNAQCKHERIPPVGEIDTLTAITITHGRLMIVGEQFPVDFIIRHYDLKSKEECDSQTEEMARIVTTMVQASHLYLAINDALKKDGFVIEIIGDKAIMNELTPGFGESDEQPVSKLSKTIFAEHPPEEETSKTMVGDTSSSSNSE